MPSMNARLKRTMPSSKREWEISQSPAVTVRRPNHGCTSSPGPGVSSATSKRSRWLMKSGPMIKPSNLYSRVCRPMSSTNGWSRLGYSCSWVRRPTGTLSLSTQNGTPRNDASRRKSRHSLIGASHGSPPDIRRDGHAGLTGFHRLDTQARRRVIEGHPHLPFQLLLATHLRRLTQ